MQVKIQSHPGERWTVSCCGTEQTGWAVLYGQCGGRLLAQKSSISGVDTDRANLVDDSDCLHGLASPFSATNPLNASVHAISLLFSCEGSDSPSGHSLGPVLQHETGDAGEVADVARDQNFLVL